MEPELLDSLKKLMADTEAAIKVVHRRRKKIGGAVNWADLYCFQAEMVRGWNGSNTYELFEVAISEAAPEAGEFQMAIAEELERRGWPGVRVVTEW